MFTTTCARSGHVFSWIVIVLVCFLILALSILARLVDLGSPDLVKKPAPVERTKQLASQKQLALETYNQQIPLSEILSSYSQHTEKELDGEAFKTLENRMMTDVIGRLWQESSARSMGSAFVTHRTMFDVLQQVFPHRTLTNADVTLFPQDSNLRTIVAEPPSDYFRDTAYHWRWIAEFASQLDHEMAQEFKELDAYAAEELSEFVSVLAVGVIEIAASRSEDKRIEPEEIGAVFDSLKQHSPNVVLPRNSEVKFSEYIKDALVQTLPNPMFDDVTKQSQITFAHRPNPSFQKKRIELEVPLGIAGGGVSAEDFDADGRIDIYFAGDNAGALYRNIGEQKFEDVSDASGLPREGETRAGYFVDFDNDGDLDLFLTFVGARNRLLENDGTGNFNDISDRVGLKDEPFISHEAVWFDMNNDGLLDLYVANFGDWLVGKSPTLGRINSNGPPNRLYQHQFNDGRHKFVEVGESLGVDDRGWTHCVGAYDYDQDGWPDLFSINDFGTSFVYRNLEGKQFEEVSREIHMDDIYNGMSFTLLDLNHDSNFSIYITQIMKLVHQQRYRRPSESTPIQFDITKKENLRVLITNRLFSQAFKIAYRDDHDYLIEPANFGWSWDASGLDYENDSDIDLIILNGTESGIPDNQKTGKSDYRKGRNYLTKFNFEQNVMHLQQDGYFYDVSNNNPIAFFGNSRSSSFLDFDNDGDLDVAISNYNSAPRLFNNQQESGNSWIRIKLIGKSSNRNAIGAVVEVKFDDQSRFGTVVSGSGFLSQNPYELHFGLGQAEQVSQVLVRWPTGELENFGPLEINQRHELLQSN